MSRSRGDSPACAADRHTSSTLPIRRPGRPANDRPAEGAAPVSPDEEQRGQRIPECVTASLVPGGPSAPAGTSQVRCGDRIGDYEVLEEIARGGMGVVYKARQRSLDRIVALKMVLRGEFAQAAELLRFHTEAKAIAQLHHPNLVSIFEVGEHGGLPFYSMEYLEGGSLARRLEGRPLPPRDAARLLLPLAQAIDYAHARGIVHRDLKPENVLLARVDVAASQETCRHEVPKITDFGIAKHLGDSGHLTRTGEVLGTPGYMAPEQAMGKEVGPAADIYSLGAILYEMLTGAAPFAGSDPAHTLLRIVQHEPASPRQLNRTVPADLATICLKCLEKSPAKRYSTAGLLAEDLRRFLASEPILARPASPWQRGRKWLVRHPVKATLACACALVVLVMIGSLAFFWRQAEDRAATEAGLLRASEEHLVEARALLADALLERGIGMAEKHDVRRGLHWMVRSLEIAEEVGDRDPRGRALAEAARYNLAHWAEQVSRPGRELSHPTWAWAVDLSPDGRFAFTACRDGHVRVWDARTGRLVGRPLAHSGPVWAVRCHPCGTFLFGAGGKGQGEIRAYRASPAQPGSFAPLGEVVKTRFAVTRLGVAPAGNHLFALLRDGTLLLLAFDGQGKVVLRPVATLAGPVVAASFSPDSRVLYFARRTGEVAAFDVQRQATAQALGRFTGALTAFAATSDGRRLVAGTFDPDTGRAAVHLLDLAGGRKHLDVFTCPGAIRGLTISPEGRRLALSVIRQEGEEFRGQVRIVELDADGVAGELYPPLEHPRPVWSLAFHPSGRHLSTGCEDRHSRLFEVATGTLVAPPVPHGGNVTDLVVSADGRLLLTACSGGGECDGARLQEVPRFRLAPTLFGPTRPLRAVQWHDNSKELFALDAAEAVLRLGGEHGRLVETIEAPPAPNHGRWFARPRHLVNYDRARGKLALTDLTTKKVLFTIPHIHPHDAHGSQVDGRVVVYDRGTKKLALHPFGDGRRRAVSLDIAEWPNNVFVHNGPGPLGVPVFGCPVRSPPDTHGTVCIWDTELNVLRKWKFPYPVVTAWLSPRGNVLAVLHPDQTRFFDVATSQPIGRAITHENEDVDRCFHPSSDIAVFSLGNGTIFLWHIRSSKPIGRAIHHGNTRPFVSARPDGSGYVSGTDKRRALAWPHLGPQAGSPAELKRWVEGLTGMRLDANEQFAPIER